MDKTKIESDPCPFPKMDIIPGLGYVKKIARDILNVIYFAPLESENTGAAPLLDKQLNEQTWNDIITPEKL